MIEGGGDDDLMLLFAFIDAGGHRFNRVYVHDRNAKINNTVEGMARILIHVIKTNDDFGSLEDV